MQMIILGENEEQRYLWIYSLIPTPVCGKGAEISVFEKILQMAEYKKTPII